jgi:hypothetical protein
MTYHDEDDAWGGPVAPVRPEDAARPGWTGWLIRAAGAVISVGFVAAVALWGWRITVRDVAEVPVVRALDAPMRVAPADPGGAAPAYQGLAVNSIPAAGTVEAPPDRLELAPVGTGLLPEDQPVEPAHIAGVSADEAAPPAALPAAAAERPLSIMEALRVAEAEAQGLSAAEALASSAAEESGPLPLMPITRLPPPSPEGAPVMSFPPRPRPAAAVPGAALVVRAAYDPAAAPSSGAQLVQLGDYPTEAEAQSAWVALLSENGDLLGSRAPVLMQAGSGAQSFWRLRTGGFDGLDEARRFCAALGARGAACLPVTAR